MKEEASDLVGLQLVQINLPEHPVVEAPDEFGSQCEPTGSCVPGDPFDASDCRLPNTVRTHARDFVKKGLWLVQPVIWGADGRAESPPALGAAVTATSALPGPIERMDHHIALAEPTVKDAAAIRAAAIFEWMSPHETCPDVKSLTKHQRCS
jgi:hypothetical protein